MKKLNLLLCLFCITYLSYGQACGIYTIEYKGSIQSNTLEIVKVQFPTIRYLEGIEKNEALEEAYIEVELVNGQFASKISSRLTSPPNSKEALLSLYKKNFPMFRVKVSVLENNQKKDMLIEINWQNIIISKIESTPEDFFEFRFGNITI